LVEPPGLGGSGRSGMASDDDEVVGPPRNMADMGRCLELLAANKEMRGRAVIDCDVCGCTGHASSNNLFTTAADDEQRVPNDELGGS
jgi:hypothetical protein